MSTEATPIGEGRNKFLFTNKHHMSKLTYNYLTQNMSGLLLLLIAKVLTGHFLLTSDPITDYANIIKVC